MDGAIVAAALAEAHASGTPIADLSLDRIARRAGISRATLFRRIGRRQLLEAAIRASGTDPGRRPGVRERALAAATHIIVTQGVAALAIGDVARLADCAMTSVHTLFGGRDGLLVAVFEQYAPLASVEAVLTKPYATFDTAVRAVYSAFFDALLAHADVAGALLAEVLAKPDGVVMHLARGHVVPRIHASVGAWLTSEIQAGRCRDLPLTLLLPLLIGPLSVHVLLRARLTAAGVALPDRDTVIDTMTQSFCQAVAPGRMP